MALKAHLVELSERHSALDRKIEEEISRPQNNSLRITELKRKKLALKDEIQRLQVAQPNSG